MATLQFSCSARVTESSGGGTTKAATASCTVTLNYTTSSTNTTYTMATTTVVVGSASISGTASLGGRAISALQSKFNTSRIRCGYNGSIVFTLSSVTFGTTYTVSYSKPITRTTTAQTPSLSISGGGSSNSVTITIPARTSWDITYNANGGTGAPATQKKYYDLALTLSSTKPTREGYTFLEWSGSNSVNYSAGGTIAAGVNQAVTLTARWHQNPSGTYTVPDFTPYYNGKAKYAVNVTGVTIYDSANLSKLRLDLGSQNVESTSSTTPTTSSPRVLEITPSAAGTFTPTLTITDSLGGTTTIVLPSIVVKQYVSPSINLGIERVNSSGAPSEETGVSSYALVTVTWNIPSQDGYPLNGAPNITCSDGVTHSVTWYSTRNSTTKQVSGSVTWSSVQTGDTVYARIGGCNEDLAYTFYITPHDNRSNGVEKSVTVPQIFYTMDFLAGGHGIAFGGPSLQQGFYCYMNALFKDKTGTMRALLDFFYPKGSYYETSDASFDPNTIWVGTWVLENPGYVHVSSGTGYLVSGADGDDGKGTKDGGESTHTLTTTEMPSHTHTQNGHSHTPVSPATTDAMFPALRNLSNRSGLLGMASGTNRYGFATNSGYGDLGVSRTTSSTTATNQNTGGGGAHNNMQPYIVVYRWHRTA